MLTSLTASVRSEGVVLHWKTASGTTCVDCRVRIDRLLVSAASVKPQAAPGGFLASPLRPEAPVSNQLLEVPTINQEQAIDETAQFGQSYEYQARAIDTVSLDGHCVTVLGQQSPPVTIQTRDIFPPAVPKGLVAVADEQTRAIDLSWSADTEPDLAGYFVYRQTPVGQGREAAIRISGPTPLPTPTFHDTEVKPGLVYAYTVSAVDQSGNESAVSGEADESLSPSP
jgi:predicted phage tail protein